MRAVLGTDNLGHSIKNPKAWIPLTVLLLIHWWLGQVVSPLWAPLCVFIPSLFPPIVLTLPRMFTLVEKSRFFSSLCSQMNKLMNQKRA